MPVITINHDSSFDLVLEALGKWWNSCRIDFLIVQILNFVRFISVAERLLTIRKMSDSKAEVTSPDKKSPEKDVIPASQMPQQKSTTVSKGLMGLVKIAAKHLPLVMGVYAMGYFNFSVAWLVGIVGITAATDQWRKERQVRMSTARASALYNDKEVIMARVSDLPSWVSANPLIAFLLMFPES